MRPSSLPASRPPTDATGLCDHAGHGRRRPADRGSPIATAGRSATGRRIARDRPVPRSRATAARRSCSGSAIVVGPGLLGPRAAEARPLRVGRLRHGHPRPERLAPGAPPRLPDRSGAPGVRSPRHARLLLFVPFYWFGGGPHLLNITQVCVAAARRGSGVPAGPLPDRRPLGRDARSASPSSSTPRCSSSCPSSSIPR